MIDSEKKQKIMEGIVKTIAFFDMFDYPVTAFDVWKFSNTRCGYEAVCQALEDLILRRKVESKNGFYFLRGRRRICDTRADRYKKANKKYKRALMIAKIFKYIPWIKMVAMSNVMGSNNFKQKSDIDLFIVTEKKRIWITRFFSVAITKILGMRPKINNVTDKICLSFFVSEDALALRSLMLDDYDLYFFYWLASIIPIYNRDETYEKLIKENKWIHKVFPNWCLYIPASDKSVGVNESRIYMDIIDLFVGGLEKNFKKLELNILPTVLKDLLNKDTRVVANDEVIKLIPNDRREFYRQKYGEKLNHGQIN